MRSPESPATRLAVAEGAGFALVAVLALGFQLWLSRVLPDDTDDHALAAVLQTEAQPGDVVLLHPWWTERARLFLPEELPLVGYLGDEGDALLEHPRIWVLAQKDLPRTPESTFAKGFLPGRTQLGPERRFGPYSLALYKNGRARAVRFAAAQALKQATASVETPGAAAVPCQPEGAGFRCPAGARVESSLHEVLYRPSQCLFVVPPGGPGAVEVTFDDVPPAATLRLEAALIWEHAWKHGSPITPLHASVSDADSGAVLASLSVEPGREGFVVAEAKGGAHRLRLRVQSDNAHEREACIQLRALDAAEASP